MKLKSYDKLMKVFATYVIVSFIYKEFLKNNKKNLNTQ